MILLEIAAKKPRKNMMAPPGWKTIVCVCVLRGQFTVVAGSRSHVLIKAKLDCGGVFCWTAKLTLQLPYRIHSVRSHYQRLDQCNHILAALSVSSCWSEHNYIHFKREIFALGLLSWTKAPSQNRSNSYYELSWFDCVVQNWTHSITQRKIRKYK